MFNDSCINGHHNYSTPEVGVQRCHMDTVVGLGNKVQTASSPTESMKLPGGNRRIMTRVAEVEAGVVAEVKKSENVFLHLRVNYGNRLELVRFRPSENLKKGDTLKITIEKY